MTVSCPRCLQPVEYEPDLAGRLFACPQCGCEFPMVPQSQPGEVPLEPPPRIVMASLTPRRLVTRKRPGPPPSSIPELTAADEILPSSVTKLVSTDEPGPVPYAEIVPAPARHQPSKQYRQDSMQDFFFECGARFWRVKSSFWISLVVSLFLVPAGIGIGLCVLLGVLAYTSHSSWQRREGRIR